MKLLLTVKKLMENNRDSLDREQDNLIGQEIGNWTVLEKASVVKDYMIYGKSYSHPIYNQYICKCKCGAIRKLYKIELLSESRMYHRDCPLNPVNENLEGKTIGSWFVELKLVGSNYQCKCECGIIKSVPGYKLRHKLSMRCRRCSLTKAKAIKYDYKRR